MDSVTTERQVNGQQAAPPPPIVTTLFITMVFDRYKTRVDILLGTSQLYMFGLFVFIIDIPSGITISIP